MSSSSRAMGLVLLCLLLVHICDVQAGESTGRHFLQSSSGGNRMSATAMTAATATSMGEGSSASASVTAVADEGDVMAVVMANSESFTDVENDIQTVLEGVVRRVEMGDRIEMFVDAEARAVATAIATAWADVVVVATSEGSANNLVCASGEAEALAVATAFAQAFAKAAVSVCSKTNVCASSDGQADATAAATATAFATASAGGCIMGMGTLSASQSTLSEAIAEAYATAIVNLFVGVSDAGAEATSQSEASSETDGEVFVDSQGGVMVTGDAAGEATGSGSANVDATAECKKPFNTCCASESILKSGTCRCARRNCRLTVASETDRVWELQNNVNIGTNRKPDIVEKGFRCFCK